jgi:hypothetical protein
MDSPVEEDGFEPSVPGHYPTKNVGSRGSRVFGQTAGTVAGARRMTRSTNSEASRQARALVINASR